MQILIICYKILFGLVKLSYSDFFTLSSVTVTRGHRYKLYVKRRVCKSGYPLSGYPDLSVNFMAAKNPDILMIDSIGYYVIKVCSVHFIQFLVLLVFTNFGVLKVHVSLSVPRIICDFE